MKKLIPLVASLLLSQALVAVSYAGDFVVIVNKGNSAPVDKALVHKICGGEEKGGGEGTSGAPADLPDESPVRASFSNEVLGKSVSNMKALWAQNVFSGKAVPPKQLGSDDDVKKFVSANKGGIGYIKPSSLDDSVKAVIK